MDNVESWCVEIPHAFINPKLVSLLFAPLAALWLSQNTVELRHPDQELLHFCYLVRGSMHFGHVALYTTANGGRKGLGYCVALMSLDLPRVAGWTDLGE